MLMIEDSNDLTNIVKATALVLKVWMEGLNSRGSSSFSLFLGHKHSLLYIFKKTLLFINQSNNHIHHSKSYHHHSKKSLKIISIESWVLGRLLTSIEIRERECCVWELISPLYQKRLKKRVKSSSF